MSFSGASSDWMYEGDVESNDTTSPGSESVFQEFRLSINDQLYEPLSEYQAKQYEDIERYRPGGLHPIHIGDYLDEDKDYDKNTKKEKLDEKNFEVLHKLGFSSSSTTWLCFDHYSRYYRAVKVFAADVSKGRWYTNPKIEDLADRASEWFLPRTIFTPIKEFWIKGPNGEHLCRVLPVLGPNLLDGMEGAGWDTPDYLQDLCRSLAGTVNYLHQNDIVHGDLRPQKIMRVMASQWMWTIPRRELFERYISEPQKRKLKPWTRTLAHHGPRYLVGRADLTKLEPEYRTNRLAITDFGRASQSSNLLDPTLFSCTSYSASEIKIGGVSAGLASDVWSLAACLHLLRTGRELCAKMESNTAFISWFTWAFGANPDGPPIHKMKDLLDHDGTILVESDDRQKEEIFSWLDRLDRPISRYKRSDSRRTFRKAEREPSISQSSVSTDLGIKVETSENPEDNKDSKDTEDAEDVENSEDGEDSVESDSGSDCSFVLSRRRSKTKTPPTPPRPKIMIVTNHDERVSLCQEYARKTGFPSLLHESIGSSETWHEMSETMSSRSLLSSGKWRVRARSRTSSSSSPDTLSENETSRSKSRSRPPSVAPSELRRSPRHKRQAEDDNVSACGSSNNKRIREEGEIAIVQPKVDTRDLVSCTETSDGMIKCVYKMQSSEVSLFADLLQGMLTPDLDQRITVTQALEHPWWFKWGKRNPSTTAPVED
jgi:serine/threonine protein kinase